MKRLINIVPTRVSRVALGSLPFILLVIIYIWASDLRLDANPDDKLMPAFGQIGDSISRMALSPSKRSGEYLLWNDTWASLKRIVMGVTLASFIGLFVGLLNGAIPIVRANWSPVTTVVSLIPPMAILPILFIVFGLGEVSKVVLIVIGITPFLIRDLQLKTMALPNEQIIKAQTLGASSWLVILRVMLPQITPRLLEAIRLSLGSAWLFLIAAEAIAAQDGLGYRIFLVRRYLAMDVILPYVAWIATLAFVMDWLLLQSSRWFFPWHHQREQ